MTLDLIFFFQIFFLFPRPERFWVKYIYEISFNQFSNIIFVRHTGMFLHKNTYKV